MRQPYVATTALAVLAALLAAGCASSPDRMETPPQAFMGYEAWTPVNLQTITGDVTGMLGRAHEGGKGFREVYINSTGEPVAMGKADPPYPLGTLITKESYAVSGGAKGKLTSLTAMVKRSEGYDPENGNWEYLNMTPTMRVRAQGPVAMCIGCHVAALDDYVFTSRRN